MAAVNWVVVPNLNEHRDQLTEAFPDRDKSSDGSIGDYAHSQGNSGHNPDDTDQNNAEWDGDSDSVPEVRARDFDSDLRDPNVTCEMVVQHLVKMCRAGEIWWWRYIIFKGRIWRKSNGWATENYTGPSPHTEHYHVSSDYSQAADNKTGTDYKLGDLVALTADDKEWLKGMFEVQPRRVWGFDPGPVVDAAGKPVLDKNGNKQVQWPGTADAWNGNGETVAPGIALGAMLGWTKALSAAVPLILSNVQADDTEKTDILRALETSATKIIQAQSALALNESQRDSEEAANAVARQSALMGAISNVDEEVLAKISNPTTPDEQVATALLNLLGERKNNIITLMQRFSG